MYQAFLYTHSLLRYVLLALLVVVIIKSLMGWIGKKPFTKADDKLSLFLLIATHLQLLAGLILYFVSPFVQFSKGTMKDPGLRYWTVEHIFMMLIAVVLITAARATQKKLPTDVARHKRLYQFNILALIIIMVAIFTSGRGLFGSSMFN